jgi:hypothetical protein
MKSIISVLGAACVCATGCLRVIDLDDDEDDRDAIVISGDAFPPVDAPIDANPDLDCSIPISCPAPSAGKATICGWIHDAETDGVVAAPAPTRQACTSATTSGPCSLRVRFFDALDFAMNPGGALPITPESATVDDCGRFRGLNLNRATFGFIAVAVDDAPGITPAEPHRLTGIVYSNGEAAPVIGRAYTTRVSTDQLWTTGAGLSGQTFAQRGVLVKVFTNRGAPVAGVTARRNGSQIPADDYYFSDTGVTRRMVVPAGSQAATGANGSVLIVNSPTPIEHDGTGAEPSGCRWPANLGASVPGVVLFDIAEAETPAGALCP